MDPIDIVCANCGGGDVRRDADASWDRACQRWELCSVFDQGYCEDCGSEVKLKEVTLQKETK